MHTIKIKFNSQEKVFEAPSNYEDFKELCKNNFGIDDLENYSVMYKDDEKDDVNVENNEDYSQALKYIKDISNILEIEIKEKINQSKTYETNEINNDDLDPMRSGAVFDKDTIFGINNNKDNDNNNKELNMNVEMKKYLEEMEKKIKEKYSKKYEDEMKEKSIKLEQFYKEKAEEDEKKKKEEEKKKWEEEQ